MIDSAPDIRPFKSPPVALARPTLGAVARAAKVSLATASYALRCDPKIPIATRQRVAAIAKQLGYVPNPELGRLMFLLRNQQPCRARGTIAVLKVKESDPWQHAFYQRLVAGMRQRGLELGYGLDLIEVNRAKMSGSRLTEILAYRGVKGVILAPLARTIECDSLLDWSRFPAVSTACSALNLPVSRVIPHYLQNAEFAMARLRAAGCRRVGWVSEKPLDEGLDAPYLTAKIMAQQTGGVAPLPTLVYSGSADLAGWLDRYHPDAILATTALLAERIAQTMRTLDRDPLPIHLLDHPGEGQWPGIDQQPGTIGKVAVELLSQLIQSGQRGAPECSTVTMIEGSWRDGAHLTAKPARVVRGLLPYERSPGIEADFTGTIPVLA